MAPALYGLLFGVAFLVFTRFVPQPIGAVILWGAIAIQLFLGARVCWRRTGLPFASAAMFHGAVMSLCLVVLALMGQPFPNLAAGSWVFFGGGALVGPVLLLDRIPSESGEVVGVGQAYGTQDRLGHLCRTTHSSPARWRCLISGCSRRARFRRQCVLGTSRAAAEPRTFRRRPHMTTSLMAATALLGALLSSRTAIQATPQVSQSPEELVQALGQFPAGILAVAPGNGVPPPIERHRREIYDRLWSLGPTAMPALCRGLADTDVQVRRGVALFLNAAGNDWYDRARPRLVITPCAAALFTALEDSDSRVRELAAQAVPATGATGGALSEVDAEFRAWMKKRTRSDSSGIVRS